MPSKRTPWNSLLPVMIVAVVIPFALATPAAGDEDIFRELDGQITAVRAQLAEQPENTGMLGQLGLLLAKSGRFEEAINVFRRVRELDPPSPPALAALAELHRRRCHFEASQQLLNQALALAPAEPVLKILAARLAMDRMDFPQARAVLTDFPADHPQRATALAQLAEIAFTTYDYDRAAQRVEDCLAVDPANSRAYLIKSLLHRSRQENDGWIAAGRRAVELDPYDDAARANLANILMRGQRQMEEGYAQAEIALRLNPYCRDAHYFIGTGWTPYDYKDQPLPEDDTVGELLRSLLAEGETALQGRDFVTAEAAFIQALVLMPDHLSAMMGQATVLYQQQRYRDALRLFFRMLTLNPHYGLAHYGVAQCLLRIRDRHNTHLAEMEQEFVALDAPEPPYLRDVFINYDGLDADLQKIIRISVQHLKSFFPALQIAGATFYLKPFHHWLWQAPHNGGLRGQRTFDLRLWDDVKGNGGFHATSGADWERDVKYRRFNVLAHEFAHQVHPFLPRAQRQEMRRLFLKAKRERRTMDFYADFNEWEYFAVGYEAYVSPEKLPGQRLVYSHTRRELQKKDPDLYRFIEGLGELPDYRESEILAVITKGRRTIDKEQAAEHLAYLDQALTDYGPHPLLLQAKGDVYRRQEDLSAAMAIHRQMMEQFPENTSGYLELAEDYRFSGDAGRGAALLAAQVQEQPAAVELWVALADLAWQTGDLQQMESAVHQALELDPYPDTYAAVNPYHLQARGFMAREQWSAAIKPLRFSLENLDMNDPPALADLALVYFMEGRSEEANTGLDQARQLAADDPHVREIHARLLAMEGRQGEATSILQELAEAEEMNLSAVVRLAGWRLTDDLDAAAALLQRAGDYIRSSEGRAVVDAWGISSWHFGRGMLAEKQKKTADAIAAYREAWDVFPHHYAAAAALLRLLKRGDDQEAARDVCQRLLDLDPPEKYREQCATLPRPPR
ncbi:MAG: tetratricopeptide repeat protein [Acidobacteria bacterium]|nr:tetratricopeptide repeat protein [Acidobacteriota bacterium]